MTRSKIDLATRLLEESCQIMMSHFENLTLEEALFVPVGGYRSALGTLKHAAAWSHVYRSYAFGKKPRHWKDIAWPYDLRDVVDKSDAFLSAVIEWFREAHRQWIGDIRSLEEDQIEENRPLHWGEKASLFDIVAIIAQHHVYHAGELNQVISIHRGEAWEEGEEVEENNIDTAGHRVKSPRLTSS